MDKAHVHQAKIAKASSRGFLASILYSILCTSLFAFSFVFILSLVAYRNSDPTKLILPFSYICLVICAFLCGFSGAKFRGSQGLICGSCCGLVFAFLLFIVSQFFEKSNSLSYSFILFTYLCIILLSSLGGLCASKKRKQKRRVRK